MLHLGHRVVLMDKWGQRMIDWWGSILHAYYAATEGGGTVVDAAQWLQRPGTVGRP